MNTKTIILILLSACILFGLGYYVFNSAGQSDKEAQINALIEMQK